MFQVIVVDDEPIAIDYICTIVKTRCPKFLVVATAENAKEGLEKVRKYKPDLIITDIKMPFMNGIDFVTKVKEEFPTIYSIIISGYQDFEYAKGAIKSGALDYILKPVNPTILKETLDNVVDKLSITLRGKRNKLIRSMSRGLPTDEDDVKRCFPSVKYYAALIRKNGLPRRFSTKSNIEIFSNGDEIIYLYGRDEMESLYIFPQEILIPKKIPDLIERILKKGQYELGYTTSVVVTKSFQVEKLDKIVKNLYKILDSKLTIGQNQIINIDEETRMESINVFADNLVFKEMECLIKEQRWDKFEEKLKKVMLKWEKNKCPQLWVEKSVRQLFYFIQLKYTTTFCEDYEFMVEDAFFDAVSMEELTNSLLEIFHKCIQEDSNCCVKADTWQFMETIKGYLKRHMAEPVTLQSVCKEFGISQTYLSKLFRKYEDTTFNNYVTAIRIECAKRLIKENKDFYIKDIATMVGYNDQFYFSRVFCSVIGMPPSVYAETL